MKLHVNLRFLFTLVSALALTACGTQQAGYQLTDRNHSLSITRDQQYPGSDWSNYVVVSYYPTCQRRYPLKESPSVAFKVDLYRINPQVFVFNHGKRWYITEVPTCRWQQYDAEPPEPGELIGSFQVKEDALVWVDNPALKKDEPGKAAAPVKAVK